MSTSWAERTLVDDVLAHGVDDWLDAGWVYQIARRASLQDATDARTLAIGLVAHLLISGFARAGEVSDDGFRAWDMSPSAALGRVVEEWLAYGTEQPAPGTIVWLAATSEGEKFGRKIIAREGGMS